MTVQLVAEGRAFSPSERRAIEDIADAAARDVQTLLPALPKPLTLVVQWGKDVIPETGETATTVLAASVYWTVDPDRDVLSTIRTELRPTLFHELHHLVRAVSVRGSSLMDRVVTEGMATAFERDFGKANPPWGIAPPEVMDWTRELLRQPDSAPVDRWLYRHPDGRRWIGLRVGTFLVDRAARASGRSVAQLAAVSTDEILRLAEVR
ncbi:MAG TPA: DUF2268 domain-containing putative Zn-dependent protease [Polyangiaceae bacterium]|nr:DUF2268 domain-containing putative Zn-dependent protease [Polyangiaceae bacterium]